MKAIIKTKEKKYPSKRVRCYLLFVFFAISRVTLAQEVITIKGRVLDAATGKEPLCYVAVNEKGVGDFFVMGQISSNRHVVTDSNGMFSIEIQKGGSLIFSPAIYYKTREIGNLNESQELEIKLFYRQLPEINPKKYYLGVEKFKVLGKVLHGITEKPLQMVTISQPGLYFETGASRHTVTDRNGEFIFTVQQGARINVDAINFDEQNFIINSDTTINVRLLPHNPFVIPHAKNKLY